MDQNKAECILSLDSTHIYILLKLQEFNVTLYDLYMESYRDMS